MATQEQPLPDASKRLLRASGSKLVSLAFTGPPSVEFRRVKLPLSTWQALRVLAEERNTTVARFVKMLLETIIKDDLTRAVIDDAPRGRVRRADGFQMAR